MTRITVHFSFFIKYHIEQSLLRGVIQKLRERRVVWPDENGKLDFDPELEVVAKAARVILSREIRHGILKLTPEKQAELGQVVKKETGAD